MHNAQRKPRYTRLNFYPRLLPFYKNMYNYIYIPNVAIGTRKKRIYFHVINLQYIN